MTRIIPAVLLCLFIAACDGKAERADPAPSSAAMTQENQEKKAVVVEMPASQWEYLLSNANYAVEYELAPNDLKKTDIYKARNKRFVEILRNDGKGINNWIGHIQEMGTTPDGHAYVTLAISYDFDDEAAKKYHVPKLFRADFKTSNNDFSYREQNTLIRYGTEQYKKLSEMQVGDPVVFSGMPQDFINLTEKGKVQTPEVLMQFSQIEPLTKELAQKLQESRAEQKHLP